jgi:hypothetical protein
MYYFIDHLHMAQLPATMDASGDTSTNTSFITYGLSERLIEQFTEQAAVRVGPQGTGGGFVLGVEYVLLRNGC